MSEQYRHLDCRPRGLGADIGVPTLRRASSRLPRDDSGELPEDAGRLRATEPISLRATSPKSTRHRRVAPGRAGARILDQAAGTAPAIAKPRPVWLLIGLLWLSTALVTAGAVVAIATLGG